MRYNTDGTLDATFSGDGKLTTDFATDIDTSSDVGQSVTVQADGKILVAGYSGDLDSGGSDYEFALARYNPDGTLDTTFSDDGKLTTGFGGVGDEGQSVTVQADDKILVAGYSHSYSPDGYNYSDFALVRYNTDGTLDTSFSGDGKLTTNFATEDEGQSVTVQADGKILVAGYSRQDGSVFVTDFALVRYNSDGTLDTSFSDGGRLTADIIFTSDDYGYSVTVQADGKILVAGSSGSAFVLVRCNTDGSLDTTFSGDGILTTDFGTSSDLGQSVTVQADGKILVAGSSGGDFALVRYNSDGTLDTTFSGDGKFTTDIGASSDLGQSVTVQADGKILVAGSSSNGRNADFALVRYNSDGTLDATFASKSEPTGTVTITGTVTQGHTLTASNTLVDANGLGAISYQWLRGGTAISGATGSSYTLTASDAGQAISVRASYTDGQGTAESKTSASVTPTGLEPGVIFGNASAGQLVTTEAGGTDSFTVALRAAPRHDVTLTFTVSDASEAVFAASGKATHSITFTAANWATAQTVVLRGVDDKANDGDVAYTISTSVSSSDLRYDGMRSGSGLSIANLIAQTTDDDTPDYVYGDSGGTRIGDDLIQGGNGASDLYGLLGRDEMHGNNGDDRLYGGYGDDVLYGNADDDELEGDQGNDKLDGGTGNDSLNGATGNDSLYGQAGNDNLLGEAGKDLLVGGNGNDTLNGGADADNMDGGNGADVYYIDNAADVVRDSGTDTTIDTVYIMAYLSGGITLGAGIDNGALNDLAGKGSLTGNTGNNALTGNASDNTLDGGVGNDSLNGGAGVDSLTGGAGTDSLSGGAGNDTLYSGDGNDVVDGGDGADLIIGGDGAGNDRYNGGAGVDTVKYTSATAAITVNLGTGSATSTAGKDAAKIGTDTLSNIENVIAGNYNDIIKGSKVANVLTGGLGTDSLYGGVDKVKDIFDFNAITESKTGTARDKVYDFVSKIDQIDLSGIDASTVKAGNQAFAFSGNTAKANSVWYKVTDVDGDKLKDDVVVYGDVNGNATADFEIGLVGVTASAAADFVL